MQETAAPPPPTAIPQAPPGRWLPLLGLIAVLLFVTLGGFLFSGDAAEVTGDVEAGATPIEVSGGVSIRPAAGWVEDERVIDPRGVILTSGNGLLLAGVLGGAGSPEEIVEHYVSGYLDPQASQLSTGTVERVSLPAGPAVVSSYVGVFEGVDVPIEGEVIGILSPSGTAVVLDGWAPEGLYATVGDEVAAMAASVVAP